LFTNHNELDTYGCTLHSKNTGKLIFPHQGS
jgi:hypothetical protein